MANTNTPRQPCEVSVIIPMYNREKYIGACLETFLAQTFTNFEIIVVDDGSTDSSCAIVEGYAEKFGGRLKLLRMKENSGCPGVPRNKGLMFSRGKYIYFFDSDDGILPNALEEMYTLAETHKADVVCYTKHYVAEDDGKITGDIKGNDKYNPTDEILVDEDLVARMNGIIENKFNMFSCKYFISRDLLFEHEIFFTKTAVGEDQLFTRSVLLTAKKLLVLPRALFIHRLSENSVTRRELTFSEKINQALAYGFDAMDYLDNVMSKIELFRANPEYRYRVLEAFMFKRLELFLGRCEDKSNFEIYEAIRQEFDDRDILTAILCTAIYNQNTMFTMAVQQFNELFAQAQRRIDELEAQLNSVRK